MISGHASAEVRESFLEAIEKHGPRAAGELRRGGFTKLWNCTDTLPGWECQMLDIRTGSSYAQAVRSLSV